MWVRPPYRSYAFPLFSLTPEVNYDAPPDLSALPTAPEIHPSSVVPPTSFNRNAPEVQRLYAPVPKMSEKPANRINVDTQAHADVRESDPPVQLGACRPFTFELSCFETFGYF